MFIKILIYFLGKTNLPWTISAFNWSTKTRVNFNGEHISIYHSTSDCDPCLKQLLYIVSQLKVSFRKLFLQTYFDDTAAIVTELSDFSAFIKADLTGPTNTAQPIHVYGWSRVFFISGFAWNVAENRASILWTCYYQFSQLPHVAPLVMSPQPPGRHWLVMWVYFTCTCAV